MKLRGVYLHITDRFFVCNFWFVFLGWLIDNLQFRTDGKWFSSVFLYFCCNLMSTDDWRFFRTGFPDRFWPKFCHLQKAWPCAWANRAAWRLSGNVWNAGRTDWSVRFRDGAFPMQRQTPGGFDSSGPYASGQSTHFQAFEESSNGSIFGHE